MKRLLIIACYLLHALPGNAFQKPERIITLSGALSEVADALGFGNKIVAVDVTSEYPAHIKQLPKVSRNRSLSVEGIMMYRPDIVLAPDGHITNATLSQLRSAGVKVVTIHQEYSLKGAKQFIEEVANALGVAPQGKALAAKVQQEATTELEAIKKSGDKVPTAIFIYARGAGAMSVAGKGSNMDAMIQLAGAKNAVQEFYDFKSYSTESLVKANPDIIILFDFGISSLGGQNSLLQMPGMQATKAGKNKAVVVMDGPLLVNFSVRLPQAIKELHQRMMQVYNAKK